MTAALNSYVLLTSLQGIAIGQAVQTVMATPNWSLSQSSSRVQLCLRCPLPMRSFGQDEGCPALTYV